MTGCHCPGVRRSGLLLQLGPGSSEPVTVASLGLSYLGQQLMATFPRTFLKPLERLGEVLTGVACPPRDRRAALHLGSWGLPCPP